MHGTCLPVCRVLLTRCAPPRHRLPSGPTSVGHVAREPQLYTPTFDAAFQGAGQTGLPPTAMPNRLALEVRPGGAFVFDNAIWHAALEHLGGPDRRCFILGYEGVFADAGAISGFALGTQGCGAGLEAEAVAGLEESGLLSPRRRGLLGLPPAAP